MSEDKPPETNMAKLMVELNPLRFAIAERLYMEPASAAQIAEELEIPVERVRYQLKQLRQAGMVEVHAEEQRRGAVERVYSVDSRKMVLYQSDLSDLPMHLREKGDVRMLSLLFREAVDAVRDGAYGQGDEAMARIPMRLDDKGWDEIAKILLAVIERQLDIKDEGAERVERSGEDPIAGRSVILFFEGADESEGGL